MHGWEVWLAAAGVGESVKPVSSRGQLTLASLPEYRKNHWVRLDTLIAAGLDGFEIVNASPKANDFSVADRDRVIAWAHPGGHRWRWELEPDGNGGTVLTETYDQSTARFAPLNRLMGYPRGHVGNVADSVANVRRRFSRTTPCTLPASFTSASSVPYCASHLAAVLGPTLATPGTLSMASPVSVSRSSS